VFTGHTGSCLAICLPSWLSHYVPLLVAYFCGLLNSISVLYMTHLPSQNLAGPKAGHRNSWENPVDEEIYVIEYLLNSRDPHSSSAGFATCICITI
jgi:hypothetical protein